MRMLFVVVTAVLAFLNPLQHAKALTIGFEEFPDSTVLQSQYAWLTFANAIVLESGIGLNEFEFPPHAGSRVAADDGGPFAIVLATPAQAFSGYFTYLQPLQIELLDADQNIVASASSAYFSNLAVSGSLGSSPNELITLVVTGGYSAVRITGAAQGSSFVVDDIVISVIPEPHSLALILAGGFAIAVAVRRRHRLDFIARRFQ